MAGRTSRRPSRQGTAASRAEPEIPADDESFARIGESVRRLALALTGILLVIRPYWPSEDAATGTGLTWVCATLVVAAVAIIASLFAGTFRYRFSWVDASFLMLVLLVGLSARLAGDRRAAINLAWEWAGIGVMFLLVRNLPRTRGESAGIAGVVVATAVAIATYGLYQAFVEIPALQKMVRANPEATMKLLGVIPGSPGEAMMRSRILGSKEPYATFGGLANSLAGFLVGPLAMALAVVVDNLRRSGRGSRLVAIGVATIPGLALLLCLLLTKSRSAWIGLAVAALVIGVRAWGKVSARAITVGGSVVAVVLVALVAGLASLRQLDRQVLTESTKSLRYRLEYWKGAWAVITNAPIPFEPKASGPIQVGEEIPTIWPESRAFWEGLGPGNFGGAYLRHKLPEASEEIVDPHNMVLDVWCSSGLIAATLLLATLGLGIWTTFRPSRDEVDSIDAVTKPSTPKRRADDPPASAAWMIGCGIAGWFAVVAFGKLDPFDPGQDLLIRWFILGAAWVAAGALGLLLWSRRTIPAAAAGIAVLAISIHLLAAGGIGMPAVALPLWVFLAIGLNLRDDLECGRLRERSGLLTPALSALVWAGIVGAFVGAIGPFWVSENLRTHGEALIRIPTPAFELAREDFNRSIEADKANVRPLLDLAELEYRFFRSPEARNRSAVWERIFLALDLAIERPWRDPYSLVVRRLQIEYARQLLQAIEQPSARDLLSLKSKILRASRWSARLYPTSATLRAQLAIASADMSMFADAVSEAELALMLHEQTPHQDKRLPPATARELKEKLPEWMNLRDNPPKPPKGN
jgi:O-antigen ligase